VILLQLLLRIYTHKETCQLPNRTKNQNKLRQNITIPAVFLCSSLIQASIAYASSDSILLQIFSSSFHEDLEGLSCEGIDFAEPNSLMKF